MRSHRAASKPRETRHHTWENTLLAPRLGLGGIAAVPVHDVLHKSPLIVAAGEVAPGRLGVQVRMGLCMGRRAIYGARPPPPPNLREMGQNMTRRKHPAEETVYLGRRRPWTQHARLAAGWAADVQLWPA